MPNLKHALLCSITVFVFLPFTSAQAAEAENVNINTNVYEHAYFAQYAPRTALDMVSRIPAFNLHGGNGGKRGLGQGGANVLINGARISGKTNAQDQLSRIAATNVVSITIVDGTSLDITGLNGLVANIITKNTGVSGTWVWYPQFRKQRKPNWFDGNVSISGEKGDFSYSATLKSDPFRGGRKGYENRFDADQVLYEKRLNNTGYTGDQLIPSLSLSWKPKADHVANLNLEYGMKDFKRAVTSHRKTILSDGSTDENPLQAISSGGGKEWKVQVGADYEFPAGPKHLNGKLKVIGFYDFAHDPDILQFDVYDTREQISGSRYVRETDEAESIIRAEYSWAAKAGRDWQASLEGAFNFLDNTASLFLRDSLTTEYIVDPDLNKVTTRVEEKRAEAALTHTRTISSKLDIQASVGAEYSEISQAYLAREFLRPKGFVTSTYKIKPTLSMRTKIAREVGQLNFSDFLSSVDLDDGENSTGNINLVPSQSWTGEVEFDKDFGHGNRLKIRFNGRKITDLVDRIPLGIDGDAIGNIDNAHSYAVHFNSTLKGDRWGLKGTQLDMSLGIHDSSVKDPLNHFNRRLSSSEKHHWGIVYRHDIPDTDWAYGGTLRDNRGAQAYRLYSIRHQENSKPSADLFLEHKDVFGMKARVNIRNVIGQHSDSERIYYTTRRDVGEISRFEKSSTTDGTSVRFNISGTF